MKKLHFDTVIKAPREKVWYNIVNDQPFREWTSAFIPGSYFEGKWEKGSRIRFLGKNKNGKIEGMTSEIAENKTLDFISIRHLGMIHDGKEDTESEEVKSWTPAYENYTLIDMGDNTRFIVDMDSPEAYVEMFSKTWPKALEKLKKISEKS